MNKRKETDLVILQCMYALNKMFYCYKLYLVSVNVLNFVGLPLLWSEFKFVLFVKSLKIVDLDSVHGYHSQLQMRNPWQE